MSEKPKKKSGYPFKLNKSSVKLKDKEEEDKGFGPKRPPRYGVFNRD